MELEHESPALIALRSALDAGAASAFAALLNCAYEAFREFPEIAEIFDAQGSESITLESGEVLLGLDGRDRFPAWGAALSTYVDFYKGDSGVILKRADVPPVEVPDTFESFATRHGLTIKAESVPFRFPARKGESDWDKSALHFAVTVYGAPEARTGARPVIWQGCYSVGSAHPVYWAKKEAKRVNSRLGWLGGNRALVSKLAQSPRAEPMDHAELRAAIVARYRELAPLELADVLESLQSDVSGIGDSSFEDWAGEYGYDTDSRSALETFEACRETARAMRAGLGREAFRAFLEIQA